VALGWLMSAVISVGTVGQKKDLLEASDDPQEAPSISQRAEQDLGRAV